MFKIDLSACADRKNPPRAEVDSTSAVQFGAEFDCLNVAKEVPA